MKVFSRAKFQNYQTEEYTHPWVNRVDGLTANEIYRWGGISDWCWEIETNPLGYIAVDFDGTLVPQVDDKVRDDIPLNVINMPLLDWLKTKQTEGYHIILWTCRPRKHTAKICKYFAKEFKFAFDTVNMSLKDRQGAEDSRKIWYDVLIDDRCHPVWGVGLQATLTYLECLLVEKEIKLNACIPAHITKKIEEMNKK